MSIAISGRDLITRALRTLGVYGPLDTPNAEDLQTGLQLLNEFIDGLAIQALTVLSVQRYVFNLVAGQGGPDHPYTFGPGGNWTTGTAARPPSIQDANLLLVTSGVSPIRIPLPILTTDMSANTPTPTLTNSLPVTLYYNDTVPLGTIVLWPIPTQAVNQIELFCPLVMPGFTDVDTLYICPPGYLKAYRLGLCEAMLPEFAVPPAIAARIPMQAADALNMVKISNLEMTDMGLDPGYTPDPRGTYVIQTDQGA